MNEQNIYLRWSSLNDTASNGELYLTALKPPMISKERIAHFVVCLTHTDKRAVHTDIFQMW